MMTLSEPNAPAVFDQDKVELIKNTICKNCSNDELQLFLHACKRSGLDPFMKQIHAVKRGDHEPMTIQTGIDGYRLIAERTGRYCPGREPTYNYDKNGKLVSATSYVKKQTKDGTWHEIAGNAFYMEYCQRKKDGTITKFWEKMPHGQLAKCAEALALRKAFPAELSGLLTQEEMQQSLPIDEDSDNSKAIEPIKKNEIEIKPEPVEKPTVKKINNVQLQELNRLFDDCSEEFNIELMKTFEDRGWATLNDIPEASLPGLRKYILDHIAKNKAAKIQVMA